MWSEDDAQLWASLSSRTGGFYPDVNTEVCMCPGTAFRQNTLVSVINTLVQTYGVDAVYLDQLHCAPYLCYATNHGHAAVGGNYFANGYRTIISDAKANSDVVLTGEEASDIYADLISGQLAWADVQPGSLPMFQSAIKDCTVEFGLNMMAADISSMASFAAKVGFQLVRGRQIGEFDMDQLSQLGARFPRRFFSRWFLRNQRNFLETAAKCRAGAQNLLLYGETLCSPDTSSAGTESVGWSLYPQSSSYNQVQETIPNVMGAPTAPNGDIGIVLVNVTSTSQRFSRL